MVSQFEFTAFTLGIITGLAKGARIMNAVDIKNLAIDKNSNFPPQLESCLGNFIDNLTDSNDGEKLPDTKTDRPAELTAEVDEDALSYLVRGAISIQLGDLMAGLADFDRAIVLEPELAIAYNSRGSVRLQLLQDREAIEDYNRAIELDSSNPEFYANRGMAYSLIGQIPRAIADFKQAISLYQVRNDWSNTRKLEKFVENLCQQYRV